MGCPQTPRHTVVLRAEQQGGWYLLAQAKGQSLPPRRGTRMDTSPSPGSCSRSPSPPVENRVLWLPEDSPAGHPARSQAVPLCPALVPTAKPACIHPCSGNGERAGPSAVSLSGVPQRCPSLTDRAGEPKGFSRGAQTRSARARAEEAAALPPPPLLWCMSRPGSTKPPLLQGS